MNKFNDTFAYDIYLLAKSGNKQKEVELFNILKIETRTIRYQYLQRAKRLGLSLHDLENYVVQALFILFKKGENIEPPTFISYFKYIYMRVVQQELRNRYRKKELTITDLTNDEDDPFFKSNKIEYVAAKEEESSIIDNDLCDKIIHKNICSLNTIEKKIISLYTVGYNLLEQAKHLNVPNSTLYNRYKSGVRKIKDFCGRTNILEAL